MRLGIVAAVVAVVGLGAASVSADAPRSEVDTFEWSASRGPQLGVVVMAMTPELRSYFGATTDRGVLVAHVDASSVASRAGARVGDVIVAVRGHEIRRARDVTNALVDLDRGVRFTVDVVRDHKVITLLAQLPKVHPTA